MSGATFSLAAITIAHQVVHRESHPETAPYTEVAVALRDAGHWNLLVACNQPDVVAAYEYRDCSKAIAKLRERFPTLMSDYPEGTNT